MSFVSILMLSLTLVYSAPIENSTVSLNATSPSDSTTLDKPILRNQEDNTPGKCCTDPSKKCCPYDYDANNCETMDTRKLCGYNKNQKKPNSDPVHVTKLGLDCLMVEDRLECGYEKGTDNNEMRITLAYSAPTTRNLLASLNVSTTDSSTRTTSDSPRGLTPGKPSLRSDTDNTPGRCCSLDPSKKCCPYDYDGNICGISDNRTLCGYNKNQEKPVAINTTTVKYGLICWPVNDRLECGYDKGSAVTDYVTQIFTTKSITKTTKISTTVTSTKGTSTKGTSTKTSTKGTSTKTTSKGTIKTSSKTTVKNIITTSTTPTLITKTIKKITTQAKISASQTAINVPGNCCSSNFSKGCCPYDYDDSQCDISDNRTVCGYNKNLRSSKNDEAAKQFTKQGLNCENKDERVECEYGKRKHNIDLLHKKVHPIHTNIHELLTILKRKSTTTATTEIKTTLPVTSTTVITSTTISITPSPTTTPTTTTSTTITPPTKTVRRQPRTTIECVQIHSKKACRVIPLDEELNYD